MQISARQCRSLRNKIAYAKQSARRAWARAKELEKTLADAGFPVDPEDPEPAAGGIHARRARSSSTCFKEKEKEVEIKPRPRRAFNDRPAKRAAGADRAFTQELGERYEAAKRAVLAMHPSPRTHFWTHLDAFKLRNFLARRPHATLDELRAMLLPAIFPPRLAYPPRPSYQEQRQMRMNMLARIGQWEG